MTNLQLLPRCALGHWRHNPGKGCRGAPQTLPRVAVDLIVEHLANDPGDALPAATSAIAARSGFEVLQHRSLNRWNWHSWRLHGNALERGHAKVSFLRRSAAAERARSSIVMHKSTSDFFRLRQDRWTINTDLDTRLFTLVVHGSSCAQNVVPVIRRCSRART